MRSYSQTLEVWQTYFAPEQLFIGFFEEIVDCPEDLLARICDFIGAEASSDYLNKINKNKVNTYSNKGVIPEYIAQYLSQIYYDEIYYSISQFTEVHLTSAYMRTSPLCLAAVGTPCCPLP